ncbi:MAG: MmgE/PrpD family protein, partial [Burkholderiales bacterium]
QLSDAGIGTAWVLGTGRRAPPADAAFLNGTAGTWLELNEGNLLARGHPSIQVLPAAIAMAQALGASGRQLLTAIVVGYETCSRLARAANVRLSIHPHGTWGVIGAAVAVGRLKRFDAPAMASVINQAAVLGLATSRQTLLEGATVRNPFTGHSGRMGIAATQMVEAGFTGLADAPSAMFTTVLSDQFDPAAVVAGLRDEWLIPQGYMKLNPTGRYVHAAFDALDDALMRRSGLALKADDIERIDVRAYKLAGMLKGQTITSSFGARFSIPFALATRIVHGNAWLEAFDDAAVANPTVQALARRIFVIEHPPHTEAYPATQRCDLAIRFVAGGTVEGHCEIMRGQLENPYPAGALRDKFFKLAMPLWGEPVSRALYEGCMNVDSINDFGAFTADFKL